MKKCKICKEEKPFTDYTKYTMNGSLYYKSYCKPCHNKEVKRFRRENPTKSSNWDKKCKAKEGLGVYLVKYRWLNLYVGEGRIYDRRLKHMKYSNIKVSPVAELVLQRGLKRKYLSFHVLEYLDDKNVMLERETHYRQVLKPYLNAL